MREKFTIIFELYLLFNAFKLSGQSFDFFEFENRYTYNKGNDKIIVRPEVNIYGEYIKEKKVFGSYFYGMANDKWGQAYGGLVVKPLDWATINLGLGVEVDNDPYRFNLNLILRNKKISLYQIYEYGGSGFWYNIVLNYQVKQNFKMGVLFKRYYGLGLNVNYSIKNTPLSIIIAPLYDLEFKVPRGMLALRFSH